MKREGWTWVTLGAGSCVRLCPDARREDCEKRGRCFEKGEFGEGEHNARVGFGWCRRVSVEVKEVKARR